MQINELLSQIAIGLRKHNEELDKIFQDRYVRHQSMSVIGASLGISPQTVRLRIIQIWEYVEQHQPELLQSLGKRKHIGRENLYLGKDSKGYTSLQNNHIAKTPSGEVISFNVGVRSNLDMMVTIKRLVRKNQGLPVDEQLAKIFKGIGPKGMICRRRFGVGRDRAMTLDELGTRWDLSRERIRLITSSVAKMIYLAEKELGAGPITTLANQANETCPKGSYKVVPLEQMLTELGLNQLDDYGVSSLLGIFGISSHMVDGVMYINDPLLTPEMVLKEIRRERMLRREEERLARKENSKQVMLVTEVGLMGSLRKRYSHLGKLSNGELISLLVNAELAMNVEVKSTDWKGIKVQTEPCTPRITMDAFRMFDEVARARNVIKNDLMAACIRHLACCPNLAVA